MELISPIAASDPKIEASLRQLIDGRDLLGQQNGVVPRHHNHGAAQADFRGNPGKIRNVVEGRGKLGEPGEMVLHQPGTRVPMLFSGLNVFAKFVIAECGLGYDLTGYRLCTPK